MNTISPAADRPPTHPGELLREEVLPALGVSVKRAAELMGVSRQSLHALLSERAPLTPFMCVRVGKLTGISPDLLMAMEMRLELWAAKRSWAEDVADIPTLVEA